MLHETDAAKIRRRLIIGSLLNFFVLAFLWAAQNFITENFWPAALLLFAPQIVFAIPTIALIIVCLRQGRRRIVLWQLPALLFLLFGFLNFNIPRGVKIGATSSGKKVRVMSYNIRYASLGLDGILETIRAQQPDVLCVQEALAKDGFPDPAPLLMQQLSDYHVARYGELLIFSRFPILFQAHRAPSGGNSVGVLETRLNVSGTPLTVFCAHLSNPISGRVIPWPGTKTPRALLRIRDRQVAFLYALTRRQKNAFLIAGDFNMPPRGGLYRRLSQLFSDGFRDAGWGFDYTFPAQFPITRIDYIWASKRTRVESYQVLRSYASDHRPIIAEIWIMQNSPANSREN